MNDSLYTDIYNILGGKKLNVVKLDDSTMAIKYNGDDCSLMVGIILNQEDQRLTYFSYYETEIPKNKYQLVKEFLSRINYMISVVYFILEPDLERVGCKATFDIDDNKVYPKQILRYLDLITQTAENYYPGLLNVISNKQTPKEAFLAFQDNDS